MEALRVTRQPLTAILARTHMSATQADISVASAAAAAGQRAPSAGAPGTTRTVALLIETSNSYARGLLTGIIQYTRERTSWSTYLGEHGRGDSPPEWLGHWKGDGIIARIENGRIAQAVAESGLPAVDVSAANLLPKLPWIETDDRAVADAAYEHLAERGFRNFAFCGDPRFNWSNWRGEHFARRAREAGFDCHMLNSAVTASDSDEWSIQAERITAWVASLPKPVGIMACYDLMGREVLQACRRGALAVPDQVAVVGVDNDEHLCELSDPPLSSVIPDTRGTGYKAAELLDGLMRGVAVEVRGYFIPPLGVAARRSSDVIAVEDADVAAALRFIRDRACHGIGVSDVLDAVPLSRRILEARFKKLIGHSPHDEIDRVRLNRVKELLRDTELSLYEIARRVGFQHAEYLSVWFKKSAGLTPSDYRREHGRRASPAAVLR
jgi:LacI family transcriptional regulator